MNTFSTNACALTYTSIARFNIIIISLGNTLSAIGNALQNSNGSIIGALANLRDKFGKSADATSEAASKLWGSLAGVDNQNDVDMSTISAGYNRIYGCKNHDASIRWGSYAGLISMDSSEGKRNREAPPLWFKDNFPDYQEFCKIFDINPKVLKESMWEQIDENIYAIIKS